MLWSELCAARVSRELCAARTGGDALVKAPYFGLLPSIEVGLCCLRKWRRGESLLFILKQAQPM